MSPVRKPYLLYLLLFIAVVACTYHADRNKVDADAQPLHDEVALTVHKVSDSTKPSGPVVTENDIIDTLNALPFVKKGNQLIDSVSHHKHGMAFIIDTAEKEYHVRAGYDREERFEIFYTFSVNKKTRDIKVLDVISDEMVTPKEFEKRSKANQ